MGDQKLEVYRQVQEYVACGVTSPSVMLQEMPQIKQWRTAKKYIEQAIKEISSQDAVYQHEREIMLSTLIEHRSALVMRLKGTKHLNQYIGGIKQLLAIQHQIIQLTGMSFKGDIRDFEDPEDALDHLRDIEKA